MPEAATLPTRKDEAWRYAAVEALAGVALDDWREIAIGVGEEWREVLAIEDCAGPGDATALHRLRLTLGYRATLQRGYAVVRGAAGQVLTNAAAASGEAALEIEFLDDRITAVPVGGKPVRPAARPKPPGGQGSLF